MKNLTGYNFHNYLSKLDYARSIGNCVYLFLFKTFSNTRARNLPLPSHTDLCNNNTSPLTRSTKRMSAWLRTKK